MKKIYLSIFTIFLTNLLFSQTIVNCGTTFYDNGGAAGMYTSGQTTIYSLTPDFPATQAAQLTFTFFETEVDFDVVTIYDNNAASGTVLGVYSGHDLPGVTFLAENASGVLTVKFQTDGAGIDNGFAADMVCVTKPTCFRPTNVIVDQLTHRTASIDWTPVNGETQWEVEYGPAGYTQGTGTLATASSHPFLIEGLDDVTSYDVYVKARCGGLNKSTFSLVLNLTTNASPNPAYVCGNLFTDEGGTSGDYYNYARDTIVMCPQSVSDVIQLNFSVFDTEDEYDSLFLFDGATVNDPLIGFYYNTNSPGIVTATNTLGCITAVFHSDESFPLAGWSATISCVPDGEANHEPVAVADASSTTYNTAVTTNVLSNDSDLEGGPFTVSIFSQSVNGVANVNGNNTVTFSPNSGFSGITTYVYSVCDNGSPSLCSQATVTITVGAPVDNDFDGYDASLDCNDNDILINPSGNDIPGDGIDQDCDGVDAGVTNVAPVANDDTGTSLTQDGANGTINILTNDTDANGNPSAPTNNTGQFVIDLDAAAGVQTVFTSIDNTSWTYTSASGILTCNPASGFNGVTTISYSLCDAAGLCDNALVSFTVQPLGGNAAPTSSNDIANTAFNTAVVVDVLSNDSDDVSLNPASVSVTTPSANGTTTINTTTGAITFTPNTGFSGTTTFTYQVCDNGTPALCASATVTVTVAPLVVTNQAPNCANDNSATILQNPIVIDVLANDTDDISLNPASVSVTTPSSDGTTTVNTTTGAITFTANAGFSGVTTFTYQVCDNGTPSLCSSATVTITVGVSGLNSNTISVSVFPNPVSDFINIESTEAIKEIKIVNIEGKNLGKFKATKQLNVSNLNSGVYFLELTFENGTVSRNQFVKN